LFSVERTVEQTQGIQTPIQATHPQVLCHDLLEAMVVLGIGLDELQVKFSDENSRFVFDPDVSTHFVTTPVGETTNQKTRETSFITIKIKNRTNDWNRMMIRMNESISAANHALKTSSHRKVWSN